MEIDLGQPAADSDRTRPPLMVKVRSVSSGAALWMYACPSAPAWIGRPKTSESATKAAPMLDEVVRLAANGMRTPWIETRKAVSNLLIQVVRRTQSSAKTNR
jgi:hypothetical protein